MDSVQNWKPGDLAVITEYGMKTPAVMVAAEACEAEAHSGVGDHWHYLARTEGGSTWTSSSAPAARRLAVIDPENAEQVERLRRLILGPLATAHPLSDFTDALREYANPTPPRPGEPSGHFAVVEDRYGTRWVNYRDPRATHSHESPWVSARDSDDFREWHQIDAVRVLSEVVQA